MNVQIKSIYMGNFCNTHCEISGKKQKKQRIAKTFSWAISFLKKADAGGFAWNITK